MSRCSEELRRGGGRDRSRWEPIGEEINRAIIKSQKLKLEANGKCKSCKNWGYSKRVKAILEAIWGKQPDIETFTCRLSNKRWMQECPYAEL